jgi:predicted SnoaL-like aldol condensation-catalyzing enzyme
MKPREVILELTEAWRANDSLRASAFFTVEGRYHESGRDPVVGRERIAEHFTRFFRDGPPWRFELDEMIIDGDRAAVAYRFSIKGDGERWRERAGCAVVRLTGGLIEEWREYQG